MNQNVLSTEGPWKNNEKKERAAVLSRLCALWALNLWPPIRMWSQPAPEGMHGMEQLVGVGSSMN